MRWPVLVCALLVTPALAGCAVGPGGDALDAEQGLFDEETGAIIGRVTDDLLTPVVGAAIALDGEPAAETDETGAFRIGHVEPGPHTVTASGEGYENASTDVDVEAGTTAETGLTLVPVPDAGAYHETLIGSGHIACSTSAAAAGQRLFIFAACGVFQVLGFNNLDSFLIDFNEYGLEPNVVGFWGESVWESNQALSNRLHVIWWTRDDPRETGETSASSVARQTGESPVRIRFNITQLIETEFNDEKVCEDFECPLLAAHYASADNSTLMPNVVVVVQQRYDAYLTVFHGGILPDVFTALPDE